MPVVNVNLLVDEKTYAGVKAGVLELCGMAKYVDNKRVAKHIPAVANAAQEGNLTIEILDALIDSLNALSKDNPSKTVDLKINASQFSNLICSIFDYTIRLAVANNIDPALISKPKMLKKKTYLDLQYYLDMQKSIFELVGEYPKVCVNLQTGVRYNYSVWRFLLWQEEKVTHHRKQQCAK